MQSLTTQSGKRSLTHAERTTLGRIATGAFPHSSCGMSIPNGLNFSIGTDSVPTVAENSRKKLLTKKTLKQYEVTVLAVHALGGGGRSVDTEDVAKKCYEMAPQLFAWQKYKDQINLELVRVSLSDAKKFKNGALVAGSGREGWRLTSKGVEWLRAKEAADVKQLRRDIRTTDSRAGSIDAVRRQREKERLLRSDAWADWDATRRISARQARQIYRVDEYTTEKMLQIKVARLRAMFERDDSVGKFLEEAERVLQKGDRNG